jgi:nucleoside-diphosphate-sugar epimerase
LYAYFDANGMLSCISISRGVSFNKIIGRYIGNGRFPPILIPQLFYDSGKAIYNFSMSYLNHALAGKRVLVTGATGFIGGRLAQRLAAEEGAIVTGTGRQLDKVPFLTELEVKLEQADLQDTAVMRQILAGQEIVFHCAALRAKHRATDDVAQHVNSTVIASLMRQAADAGVKRFVHVSSMNAYGPPQRPVVDENHPLNSRQRDTYGRTKAQGEEIAWETIADLDLELVVVRPGMVYGPRSDGWSIRMVEVLQKGLPVIFGNGQGNTYQVYIDNLIDGMLLTAVHPQAVGEAFNFLDPPVDWNTFFGYYAAMSGEKARAIPCGRPGFWPSPAKN